MKLFALSLLTVTTLFSSVDINNATTNRFATLKGVEIKKANAIIEYRNSIKCFKLIDELTKVKGIEKSIITNIPKPTPRNPLFKG